ncbi:DUF6531 domain-containing protein [Sorangium sp. So ce1024]|uniref:DUF6531 domain-containing protein n=1 Tax=unclassified Sorangium TaxID=2621164 RepID=UPI003F0875EE
MAHNFHDINGWLIVGLEMHQGFHIFPPAPMKFLKLVLLHPFTLGDRQQPTVLFNGVPSVTHQHEPTFLWPHLGIIPDPLDALTPLHILFGSHKCWLPRGAVEICGEKATCCVIGGPMSLNADCWDIGRWPTSLVLNPGTVQTTPTFADFAMGAVTLAIDLVLDLLFEGAAKLAGGLLRKLGGKVLKPLFKKGKDLIGKGLKAATKKMGNARKALAKGVRALKDKAASAAQNAKCTFGLEPIDLASGRVIDSDVDISLPGAIPLVWTREYSSARALERTSLGRGGWTHSFDQWIERDEDAVTLRDQEGRDVYFRPVRPGKSAFHRPDRLTLTALDGGAFDVYSHVTRLTRRFEPAVPGGRALLRSIRDARGHAIRLEYAGNRLQRLIDTAGRELHVQTTHGGRVARVEVRVNGALEQWVNYTYTRMGELASAADALGHVERYEYDEDHRLVKKTLKNGVSFYYEYDAETGWCRRSWGDGGLHSGEIRADLDARITRLLGNTEPRVLSWNEDGLVTREQTPDGIVLRTAEYDRDGYLLAESNGGGEVRRFEYDALGNKIREIDPAGNMTEWSYEDDLPVVRIDPGGLVSRYERGTFGEITTVTYPDQIRFAFSYDDQGHLRDIRGPEGLLASFLHGASHQVIEEVDARGARTTYVYDPLGRPTLRTDALGRTTAVEYDRLGRPVTVRRADGTVTRTEYNALGDPIRTIDALGNETRMKYIGTGSLVEFRTHDGRVWRFSYTADEKLRRVENPRGDVHELEYDSAGRVTMESTFDGRVLRYRHSPAGRLARVDYPDGTFRAFTHDPLGNVTREESSDGPIVYQRDRMGRLLGAVLEQDGRQIVTLFERDALGQITAEIQGDRAIRYRYDAWGRRSERVLPDGSTTRYVYDRLHALVGVEHDGKRVRIDRDVLGREVACGDAAGSFSIQSAYDTMDRLIEQRVSVRAPGGEAPLRAAQRQWRYDAAGRMEQVDDLRWGTTTIRHDPAGQLSEVRRGAHLEIFEHDAAGSVTRWIEGLDDGREADGKTWTVAPGNLLLEADRARYAYDRRGRRVLKRTADGPKERRTEYLWDCRDRLRGVRLASGERFAFHYDALGRRLRKEMLDEAGQTLHAVDFLWDMDVLAADLDSEAGARCFVHEPGTFLPLLQAERGEVFVYLNDPTGVPRELIDSSGKVAWSAAHSAWGRLTAEYSDPSRAAQGGRAVASPFRLMGQYADDDIGLCYARFRYFDADAARWCSPDPLGLLGGRNLHAFDGSPTVLVDPLGLVCKKTKLLDADGNVLATGSSGSGRTHAQPVQDALNGIQPDPTRQHVPGDCAEPSALTNYLNHPDNRGVPVQELLDRIAKIETREKNHSGPLVDPCPYCEEMLTRMGLIDKFVRPTTP